jgi:hypothetical protein
VATRYPVKLAVGLVLGAVVLSGTAVYFGPSYFQEKRSPVPGSISFNELTGDTFRIREEQRAADRQDDLQDMIRYWNQLKADGPTQGSATAAPPTNDRPSVHPHDESLSNPLDGYEVEIERLENQIDSMLAEAARDPSKDTPSLHREIEHLDEQIEMIRLNAMKDASVGRPFSSDQGQVGSDSPYPDTEY